MNPTPLPVASPAPGGTSLTAVAVVGIVIVLILLAVVFCVVFLLSVLMKSSTRRADARLALQEAGGVLVAFMEKLVDLIRGRRRESGSKR